MQNEPINTRLLLIEGIPGSGKTTTAQYAYSWLIQHGRASKLFLEGNLDHPADYESVACLDKPAQLRLSKKYPALWGLVLTQTVTRGDEILVRFQKLRNTHGPQAVPENLFQDLASFDIYNGLCLPDFSRLALAYWEEFSRTAYRQECTYVFEGCFLQNPITNFIGRHNSSISAIQRHLKQAVEIIAPLTPALVYLDPGDIRAAFQNTVDNRPKEWFEGLIHYVTRQGYGKANGLTGLDGICQFYEMMREIQMSVVKQWSGPLLFIDDARRDWESSCHQLSNFLSAISTESKRAV